MKSLVDKFRLWLTEKRMSANTVRAYMNAVYTYYNIYGAAINEGNLNKFQNYLEQHYRPKTVNLRVIAFNKFLAFAGYKQRLRLIKCQQKSFLEDVISYSDYLRFKSRLSEESDQKWYFIVWTLASTGVRISELVQFRAEHAFDGMLDLRSKGNKVRRIYIPRALRLRLTKWLTKQNRLSGPLFLNAEGQAISIRGISKGLERHAERYGMNKRLVHPHAFRHLFAKKFLETKNDLTMLADLLGHESLDTTKIYLRMTSQEQRDIIDKIVEW